MKLSKGAKKVSIITSYYFFFLTVLQRSCMKRPAGAPYSLFTGFAKLRCFAVMRRCLTSSLFFFFLRGIISLEFFLLLSHRLFRQDGSKHGEVKRKETGTLFFWEGAFFFLL